MSSKGIAENSLKKLIMNIVVVVVFASLMASFIAYFIRNEPNLHDAVMEGFARQFQQSAENAHWQWQAKGRPERIMLLHFNDEGKETDRRPVRMTHTGRPWAALTSDGCAQLWQTLLNVPARVDGFRVIAEYYSPDEDQKDSLGRCRYRLSRGAYFDYALDSGNVDFEASL